MTWRERVRVRRKESREQRKNANRMLDDAERINRRGLDRDDQNPIDYNLNPRPHRVGPGPAAPASRRRPSPARRSTMPDPFEGPKEAAAQARGQFDPETANDLVEWTDGLPGWVDANVSMISNMAEKVTERIRTVPEYSDAVNDVTKALARLGDQVSETGDILRRRHAGQLEKIARQDPRDTAWDNSRNPA